MPIDRKPEFFKGTQLKVAIIGCGYVGLPLGLRFAEAGHKVTGFDTDPKKVSMLNAGKSYIVSTGGAAGVFTCGSDAGFTKFIDTYKSSGMVGVDFERARAELAVPDRFQIEMAVAVGRRASESILPASLREREKPTGRIQIAEFAFEGRMRV